MNFSQAQSNIVKLLEYVNIKHIYYIDDEEGIEEYVAKICAKLAYFNDTEWAETSLPLEARELYEMEGDYNSLITEWFKTLPDESKSQTLQEFGIESIIPTVKQLLGDICSVYTDDSWQSIGKNDYEQKLKNKENILILFDKHLNKSDGTQMAVEALAVENAKQHVYCGIISKSFTVENEFVERTNYKCNFYPISKSRIDINNDNYEAFVEGIKNTLWLPHIEKVKEQISNLFNQILDSSKTFLNDIQPPTFKQIVIDSSYTEGCREIDTILRLVTIIFENNLRHDIYKSIKDDNTNEFYNHLYTISKISTIETENRADKKQINNILEQEAFIEGEVINGLFFPLQNGDIFEIKDKLFILLAQPCNIALRNDRNGIRRIEHGFLVPLELKVPTKNKDIDNKFKLINRALNNFKGDRSEISTAVNECKAEIKSIVNAQMNTCRKIHCPIMNKEYFAMLNEYKIIDLPVLDYTTFRADGLAIINTDDNPVLHSSLVHRKQYLERPHNNWAPLIEHIESLLESGDTIIEKNKEKIAPSCIQRLKLAIIKDGEHFSLPVKRIGHLKDPYSSDLLMALSQYISRTGFPNSFM